MEQMQFKKEILPLRERLILYAERLLESKSDAEDIIQEVFLKLWCMRDELRNYVSV
jgi:RNA polymerase sigma-70 factor (ECF subfamily)